MATLRPPLFTGSSGDQKTAFIFIYMINIADLFLFIQQISMSTHQGDVTEYQGESRRGSWTFSAMPPEDINQGFELMKQGGTTHSVIIY